MSYKTIVVHVDHDRRAAVRIQAAADLASHFGAHLVGLHATSPARIPNYVRSDLVAEVIAHEREARRAMDADLGAQFEQIATRAGVDSREWRLSNHDPVDALTLHGRYADLLVLSQNDPDEDNAWLNAETAEQVALHGGRPVLVIPYAGAFPEIGKRVLLGWNASREATRAMTDALPLLQRAERVTLLTVNADASRRGRGGPHTGSHGDMPGADCALYLARHGVEVEVNHDPGVDIDTGNYLLSRATDLEADLLVMGAWGHARLRELIMGGVTRTLMQHMTIPVLLSH
jgi:nucleotide-binding universal stress UspA family protein